MGQAWGTAPRWIWVQHAVAHPAGVVAEVFPDSALHIATSSLGVMANGGAGIGGEAGSGGGIGALTRFAYLAEGDELHLLGGTPEGLTAWAARTVAPAMEMEGMAPQDVAGALVIFCSSSMLAMQASMDGLAAGIDVALCGAPFMGGSRWANRDAR